MLIIYIQTSKGLTHTQVGSTIIQRVACTGSWSRKPVSWVAYTHICVRHNGIIFIRYNGIIYIYIIYIIYILYTLYILYIYIKRQIYFGDIVMGIMVIYFLFLRILFAAGR